MYFSLVGKVWEVWKALIGMFGLVLFRLVVTILYLYKAPLILDRVDRGRAGARMAENRDGLTQSS